MAATSHWTQSQPSSLFSILFDPKWFPSCLAPITGEEQSLHAALHPTLVPELHFLPSSHCHYHLFRGECIQRAPACQWRFKSDSNLRRPQCDTAQGFCGLVPVTWRCYLLHPMSRRKELRTLHFCFCLFWASLGAFIFFQPWALPHESLIIVLINLPIN